ncbi:acyl-CoA dehydrogenase family protein [Yinghuangia sp. ASG 101]|uniref:acyl-CoA dehydrogenase family protein n=1 Tax=Yinghuangia sp. ASG 101 TaxID=2896848 RepID=UPI001E493A7D|nr:acyl-CoA dehydrogenase family protein [Yinghuangia sp. ASG 101]UGQ11973.1 acyl-CoA dehydrogenase family protein [Yinghuangia sp. ASG 101]
MTDTSTAPAGYPELAARFRPVFDHIAAGAVAREQHRELAYDAVARLAEAGFTAVRVPVEYGGSGASVTDLFRLLVDLGEADSNLPQILRAHFGFTEDRLADAPSAARDRWLRRIGDGAVVGNAATEIGDGAPGRLDTALSGDPEGPWHLTGSKHYSTGSLYADWIAVLGQRGDDLGWALVRGDAPGVERVDDWDGFGQRLTASGTTRLDGVAVDPDDVFWRGERGPNYMYAFYQLVHLATLSGVARAVVRDGVDYVRGRRRVFSHGSGDTPAADPLVQQVVGRLAAYAFTAEATTLAAVAHLEEINRLRPAGPVPEAAYDTAEIAVSKAYITVADAVLTAATLLFETGGASTVAGSRALDRHWRNARTLSVHNPVIYKQRVVGDHLLNRAAPAYLWSVGVKE